MLVAHDMRVRELAEFAAIPTVEMDELLAEGIQPEMLRARVDGAAFEARQRQIYRGFRTYFDLNEVPHHLSPDV